LDFLRRHVEKLILGLALIALLVSIALLLRSLSESRRVAAAKVDEARLAANGALAGSTLQFNNALKNIAEVTGMPLSKLIKTTSLNQAISLGLKDLGKIEPGYVADLAVLDDDFRVTAVFVDGARKV